MSVSAVYQAEIFAFSSFHCLLIVDPVVPWADEKAEFDRWSRSGALEHDHARPVGEPGDAPNPRALPAVACNQRRRVERGDCGMR